MMLRRSLSTFVLLAAATVLLPRDAGAGGFVLYEFGAWGTGTCGAQGAVGLDASTLFLNPAAMTRLDGTQFSLGASIIKPFGSYEATGQDRAGKKFSVPFGPDGARRDVLVSDGTHSVDQEPALYTPPHFYVTHRIGEVLGLGFAFNTPYGLGVDWPRDWDGRYLIKKVNLETFVFNPNIALDLGALLGLQVAGKPLHVSLAAGYMYAYSRAFIDRNIDFRGAGASFVYSEPYPVDEADLDGRVTMDGSGTGHSFNLALQVELPEVFALGAGYRHGFTIDYSGDATFTVPDWMTADRIAFTGRSFPPSSGAVSMNMPKLYNFGIALLAIPKLRLEADLYLEDWTTYESLTFDWGCNDDATPCNIPEEEMRKDWEFNYQISLGAEYTLDSGLGLRVGYGHVGTPVPKDTYDPMLPDGERDLFTLGAGYPIGNFRVDAGYMLALWEGEKSGETVVETDESGRERTVYVNDIGSQDATSENGRAIGTYETVSHIFALTVGAKF